MLLAMAGVSLHFLIYIKMPMQVLIWGQMKKLLVRKQFYLESCFIYMKA